MRLGEKSQNFSEIILSLSYRGWFFCLAYFLKYFLHSPLRMKTAFLRKKRKSFEKNLPIIGWPRNAQAVHRVDKFFCIYYPTEEKKAVLAVIIEKISLHSPLDTKTRFGRTFFEKIKIFIPLYLSGKNVNPHQCICRCHQKDKNDKVYQGQIPKVLLGKNSIKIHKKSLRTDLDTPCTQPLGLTSMNLFYQKSS